MKFKGNTKTTQQTSLLKHAKQCKRGLLHSIASVATACKRRTLKGHHCRDHMRLLQRLAIAPSTLGRHAGDGLFHAKYKGAKPLRNGDEIVLYSGDWVPLLPNSDEGGGPYFLEITQRLGVDAARTNTALGRWANDP